MKWISMSSWCHVFLCSTNLMFFLVFYIYHIQLVNEDSREYYHYDMSFNNVLYQIGQHNIKNLS